MPPVLLQGCRGAVDIPDKDLTATEIARLWAVDRTSLGECVRKHMTLAEVIQQLEQQFR